MVSKSANVNLHYLVQIAFVVVIYSFCGWLGINFASIGAGSLALIWLPSGISLSACILFGGRIWPAIFIASFLSNTPFLYSIDEQFIKSIILGLVVACIDTSIGGIFAYKLYKKYVDRFSLFSKTGMTNFVLIVCLIPSIIIMVFALGPLWYFGGYLSFPAESYRVDYWFTILSGILSDYHGYFVITPFIVSIMIWGNRLRPQNFKIKIDVLILAIYIAVGFSIIKGFNQAIYLLIPLGGFITSRYYAIGASGFVLFTSLLLSLMTAANYGPFILEDNWHSFVALLMFVFGIGIPLLLLAVERMENLAHKSELKNKVKKRTKELADLIVGLENQKKKLSQAKQIIEKESLNKSRFLTRASHDIRQPLQVLNMYLASIKAKGKGILENTNILIDVEKSISNLSLFFTDLLDINNISKEKTKPRLTVVNLNNLLMDVQKSFSIENRNHDIRLKLLKKPVLINTDLFLLRRIINNLISNALKHGANKAILLAVKQGENGVFIEVWDQGKGIPDDELENIFTEFYLVSSSYMAHPELNYGLGLAIVKKCSDLLGYQVNVYSKVTKGSVFKICIPNKNLAHDQLKPEPAEPQYQSLKGAVIALIDNDKNILKTTQVFLQQHGMTVYCALNSKQLLDKICTKRIDFIIADYHLSQHQTGLQLIESIRKLTGELVPAVLVTGDMSIIARDTIDVLYKPIHADSLIQLIYQKVFA